MNTTPPRRNAVTEPEPHITPLHPKTSSVPLDGRVLKAATLDAELTTELENASIHEQAGLKGSYIVFWCELSALKNLPRIKARNLKTEEQMPLFLGSYWDPSFIPAVLRQPESKSQAEPASSSTNNSSDSRTRRTRSNTVARSSAAQRQSSKATPKQSRTTSSKSKKRGSLRREAITRTIPNTAVQETVEAYVLPLAGSEEASVAAWLNKIIASFPAALDPKESRPEGWGGLRLTRSMTKETMSTHPLRLWSSQYASKPVDNLPLTVKPDIVFCGQLDPRTGFEWQNVMSFLELTSSAYSAQLERNIIRKAYAVFMSQPCRRFVVALSIAHQEFRLHLFDRSGAIHSLGHNLHKSADLFARLLYVFAFGNSTTLGFDPTFVNSSLSPSILFRPHSNTAIQKSRLIYMRNNPYAVVRPIFISHLIRGRATSSWLVKRNRKSYVVKDYWTHEGRKITEEEILKKISGLRGVPELIEAWTVQINDADETTDFLRPEFLVRGMEFETRIHRRLLMTPVGEPLINFGSLQELVSIFIDIVHVHFTLVDVYCVLHRDISLNNILIYFCPKPWPASSDVQRKREGIIADKKFRRGLLIDFDYSSMLNRENQGVSSGHRTGTVPFMAIDLLREYTRPSNDFVHKFSHDLESLIYVLVWVCIVYQAPNEIRRDKTIEQTCLRQWALAKTLNDIQTLYDQKLGQLQSESSTVFDHFTPYFGPLKPFVIRLYKLIRQSRDPDSNISLTHAAVTDILMDAFNTVEDVPHFQVTNAKRTWQRLKQEPVPPQSKYHSETRNVRRRLV